MTVKVTSDRNATVLAVLGRESVRLTAEATGDSGWAEASGVTCWIACGRHQAVVG